MIISCMIIEDEPLARQLLEEYIKKIPSLNLIKSYSSPIEALDAISNDPPDAIFLDIQMPELTGIDFLRILKPKVAIVLTTAYAEYAIESYVLNVTDYLLKPITLERFLQSIEKIKEHAEKLKQVGSGSIGENIVTTTNRQTASEGFFFVKDGTRQIKIDYGKIVYIEGMKDYLIIHLVDKKITSLLNLKKLDLSLPSEQFVRVHNSFIIAVNYIKSIERNNIEINDRLIPISDTYRWKIKELIAKWHVK